MREFGSSGTANGSAPSLAELLARAATRYASRIAVAELGGRRLTFAQVGERAGRLAAALGELVDPEDRVAVLMPNALELVEIDIGLIRAAVTRVPVNPRLAPDERDHVLRDCEARLLIAHVSELEYAQEAKAQLDTLTTLIVVGAEDCAGAQPYERVLEAARSPAARWAPRDPDRHISQLLYTSGTTGRPKGAALSERIRIDAARRMLTDELRDVGPDDGMAHVAPMSHGSGSKVIAHHLRGSRNVPVPRYDPELFVRQAADAHLTCTFLVPTMVAMLADVAEAGLRAPDLRTITYGGAPMPLEQLARAREMLGPVLVQVYGSCEAPHPLTILGKEEHEPAAGRPDSAGALRDHRASAGREATFASVSILDDDGEPVANGEVGELAIPRAFAMERYWNDPQATEAAFSDGYFRTGDIARRDDAGFLYIIGRTKDVIISGGFNVYPAEVERVLAQHPDVRDAAVIGVPDDRWGELVTAWVVAADGRTLDADVLDAHCARHLAGYKRPRRLMVADDLPRGSTGKVLKDKLRGIDRPTTTEGQR